MEVCIFGVLTVNLLTFSLSERSSLIRMPSLPMLVKDGWRALAEKAQTPCYSPFYGLI